MDNFLKGTNDDKKKQSRDEQINYNVYHKFKGELSS